MALAGEVLGGFTFPRVTDKDVKARILQQETHLLGCMEQEKGAQKEDWGV